MPLNPQQEEVVQHFEGRALVMAGPGSGKTSTITARVGQLLYRQVPPGCILCITFTNKAAQEMRERIAKKYTVGKKIKICTFHALCGELLRRYGEFIGYTPRMTIIDTDDQEDLLAQIARQKYASDASVEFSKPRLRKLLNDVNNWRESLEPWSKLEDRRDEGELSDHDLVVMQEYLRRLHAANCTDFSGLLSEAVRLLKTKQPKVPAGERLLAILHKQYRFIQVDEYQDTNIAQNEIVELLSGATDNVLAVGDQDQSIYEWRGASPEAIDTFVNRGRGKKTGATLFKLSTNYRSTPEIIATADRLIKHSPKRVAMEFAAARESLGKPPRLDCYLAPEEEAKAVAEKVKACINLLGVPPAEIAVFYRLNDMSRPVETALARLQIPYKVFGGLSFYDRAEIRDCISMLRVIANPKDSAAFARVVNKPKRGVGEKGIGLIENYAAMKNIDLIAACGQSDEIFGDSATADAVRQVHYCFRIDPATQSPADCLAEAVSRTGYIKHLESHEKEDAVKIEERKRNVQELINSVALWGQDEAKAGHKAAIGDYLGYIQLLTSADNDKSDNAVRLMSLHASKGLEFDIVFMVGVEAGLLPHKKAVTERADLGVNEERRLCYVGFTRARKQLFVSYCQQRPATFQRSKGGGGGVKFDPARPSQFLLESGLIDEMAYLRKAPKSMVS